MDSSCLRTVCFPASTSRAQQPTTRRSWNYEERRKGRSASAAATAASSKPDSQPIRLTLNRRQERRRQRLREAGDGGGHQAAGGPGASGQGGQNRRRCCRRMSLTILRCSIRAAVFQLLKQQYSRYTPEMVERITGIPKDQFVKAADLFTSIRKDGDMKKAAHDHLCGRLDAAHVRHADHPHRGDPAIAAGQCRPRWRRCERAARSLEHSGRDRHGRRLRHLARLPEDVAQPDDTDLRDFPETYDADDVEAERMGLVSTTGRTRRSSRCRS